MQFGFCTPWISQGRLSNQFMFSELFKCMLCLHDRWLWPPLNHPSFPRIFFSPSKINIKRSPKEYCKGNRKFIYFFQLIPMKFSNPDGMNNSTYVRADRDMGHRPPGRQGGTAEYTWALEPGRPGSNSRWAALRALVLGKSPHLSIL